MSDISMTNYYYQSTEYYGVKSALRLVTLERSPANTNQVQQLTTRSFGVKPLLIQF